MVLKWQCSNALPFCSANMSWQQCKHWRCYHWIATLLSYSIVELQNISTICAYIHLHIYWPIFLSSVNKIRIFLTDFNKSHQYQISWKSVQWEPGWYMWMDREDMMKLIDTFVTSLNVPKSKWTHPTREIVMWGQRRLEKIISGVDTLWWFHKWIVFLLTDFKSSLLMWNLLWAFVDCIAVGYVAFICLRNSLYKLNIVSLLTLTMKMEAANSSNIQ